MLTQENAHKEFEGWLNRCRAANIDIKAILQASGLRTDRGFHKADGAKPPKPVVFDTLQAFHGALQHARPSAESFFAMRSDTIEALVTKSVEGNTFRAFHLRARGHHPGPASLYPDTSPRLKPGGFPKAMICSCCAGLQRAFLSYPSFGGVDEDSD